MIVLPGWNCPSCQAFNGSAREELTHCRCCGVARPARFIEIEPLETELGSWRTRGFYDPSGGGMGSKE